MNTTPGRKNTSPGRMNTAPGRMNTAPGRVSARGRCGASRRSALASVAASNAVGSYWPKRPLFASAGKKMPAGWTRTWASLTARWPSKLVTSPRTW